MDQPGVAVKVEEHRLIEGKQAIKVPISQAVAVPAVRLQLEQINNVNANVSSRMHFPWYSFSENLFLDVYRLVAESVDAIGTPLHDGGNNIEPQL